MPMYIGELPGYYFDAEKQKYYKIVAEQDAPNADFKYTVHNLEREREQQAARSAQESHEQNRLDRRGPAAVYRKRPEALFLREIGYGTGKSSSTVQRSWASSTVGGFRAITVAPQLEDPVRHFDFAPESQNLYVVMGDSEICSFPPNFSAPVESQEGEDEPPAFPYIYGPNVEREPFSNPPIPSWRYTLLHQSREEITSLHYISQHETLVATTRGPNPQLYVTKPVDEFAGRNPSLTNLSCKSVFRCTPCPSFGASESSMPSAAPINLAIGSTKGMWTGNLHNDGALTEQRHLRKHLHILDTEYLSADLIASGSRSGEIYLTDVRSRKIPRRPQLNHPSPISNIRRTDSSFQIVVSGISRTIRDPNHTLTSASQPAKLCLYDIRMCKPLAPPETYPAPPSIPIVEYPFYHNDIDTELGLDVHPHLGLIAAANCWGQLSIWNLRSGDLLNTFEPKSERRTGAQNKTPHVRNRVVKFVEDDGGSGGVSLWSCWMGGVARFGW